MVLHNAICALSAPEIFHPAYITGVLCPNAAGAQLDIRVNVHFRRGSKSHFLNKPAVEVE
jgi:hypothetical protein